MKKNKNSENLDTVERERERERERESYSLNNKGKNKILIIITILIICMLVLIGVIYYLKVNNKEIDKVEQNKEQLTSTDNFISTQDHLAQMAQGSEIYDPEIFTASSIVAKASWYGGGDVANATKKANCSYTATKTGKVTVYMNAANQTWYGGCSQPEKLILLNGTTIYSGITYNTPYTFDVTEGDVIVGRVTFKAGSNTSDTHISANFATMFIIEHK